MPGWRSKVTTAALGSGLGGEPPHRLDDRLVAAVHAVVGADREHRSLAVPRRRIEVGDDLHELDATPARARPLKSLTAITTAGFATAPNDS